MGSAELASTAGAFAWPLVGRTAELELIDGWRSEGGAGAVVAGPPGVGKSRLARELLGRAAQAGTPTRWLQATRSTASVPLGAFAAVLPESARSEHPTELLRLGVEAVRTLGDRRGGLVLAVDDAHLLDPSSAALVLELAWSTATFVLVTVRRGEPCPDAVVSLWKDAGAARLDLEPLDREQTEALVEEITGGPVEQAARRWIHEMSLGNPLYIRELTLGALGGGALVRVHGLWRMPSRPPVTASLAELIAARMAGLRESERRALELLALGEPLRVSELVSLVGEAALTAVERRGLATVAARSSDADVMLAHPLYGETLRGSLPGFRARQLMLDLAAEVQRRPGITGTDRLRVARWRLDAGEEISTDLLLDAASGAIRGGDPGLGVKLAERASASGGGVRAGLLLAQAQATRGELEAAAAVLDGLEGSLSTREDALEYLEQQTAVLFWGLRRADALGRLLARALTWWDDADWIRRVHAIRLISDRSWSPGQESIEAAGLVQDDGLDPDARRRIAAFHLSNVFRSGRVREAEALARRSRPSVPLRDLCDEIMFMLAGAIAVESGEDFGEVDAWASGALAEAIAQDDHAAAARSALTLGGLRLVQGSTREAGRWLAEAELQFERRPGQGLPTITAALQVGVAT